MSNQAITPTTLAHDPLIAAFSSLACKLGSVAGDESIVSKAASSVFHTHADIGATWVQTTFLEALGHSPHISAAPTSKIGSRKMVR